MREETDRRGGPEGEALGTFDREEDVIETPHAGREIGCEPAEGECTDPAFGESAYDDDPVGGTPDDLPYSLGEELPDPLDRQVPDGKPVLLEVALHHPEELPEEDEDEESPDERELWQHMEVLSGEDEQIGAELGDVSDDQAARIMNALGDDAAEVLPQAPEGVSATGAGSEPFRPGPEGEE